MDLTKIFERYFSKQGQVVQRKDMPNPTLAKLRLASHPEAKPSSLRKLAKHECESIVIRVAENPNTPVDVLEDLAHHEHPEVRVALSENPNATARILMVLVEDEHADVRYGLAENHNTPLAVLSRLCEDENPYVADRAQNTLNRLRNSRYKTQSWAPFFRHKQQQRDIG